MKKVLRAICAAMVLALCAACAPEVKSDPQPLGNNAVESISLSPQSVAVGNTVTLSASVLPANATNKAVTWASSDTSTATVDAVTGVVTGIAVGTTTITATAKDGSGKFGTAVVTVTDATLSGEHVNITGQEGWLESAYVKWTEFPGATSYNVYYKGGSVTTYTKVDTQLVRKYPTYYRADVLGLAAGSYDLKVVPVISGSEIDGSASEAGESVLAHDRSGYAFASGRVPGGYKADGTLKADARIIYVTDNNKDTVTLGIRQDSPAKEIQITGLQNILNGVKKGNETRPLIIRLIGKVGIPATTDKGDIVIEDKNNANAYVTIEGVGDDAVAYGWGIRLKNATNIEINNIGFMQTASNEGDDIGLQQSNYHIWVHNCDLFYGKAGGDADQAKGDGAMDSKGSTYVTMSYNHFWDNGKTHLLGNGEYGPEGDGNTIPGLLTLHHNWYDHSDSRHPRVRIHTVHVYNNYYDGVSKYGIGAVVGASIFAEANYFRATKKPMLISMQGTDVWNGSTIDLVNSPTFSKELGGSIKAYNNYFNTSVANYRFVPYSAAGYSVDTTVDFDAYVVTSRNEQVPVTVTSSGRGSYKTVPAGTTYTYNNFDTDAGFYTYPVDNPEAARTKVMQYAGRYWGGDFEFTFTTTDDPDYNVNTALQAKLVNYTSQLVSVQGGGGIEGAVGTSFSNGQAVKHTTYMTKHTISSPWAPTSSRFTGFTIKSMSSRGMAPSSTSSTSEVTNARHTADRSFQWTATGSVNLQTTLSLFPKVALRNPSIPSPNFLRNASLITSVPAPVSTSARTVVWRIFPAGILPHSTRIASPAFFKVICS
jgi:pectate lyase